MTENSTDHMTIKYKMATIAGIAPLILESDKNLRSVSERNQLPTDPCVHEVNIYDTSTRTLVPSLPPEFEADGDHRMSEAGQLISSYDNQFYDSF